MGSSRYHNPYLATLDRPVRQRLCDSHGCGQAGQFRAPKSRDKLNEYYWFCYDHVREYNANWNYLDGLSAAEIEEYIRNATVWERPTWPPATAVKNERKIHEEINRAFFSNGWNKDNSINGKEKTLFTTGEQEALLVLGLRPPVSFTAIKERYRLLVKKHHPDTNGGNRKAEERLKIINYAFTVLKGIYKSENRNRKL